MPNSRRVTTYIDGVSLYHRLKAAEWRKYMWLDLVALSENLITGRSERKDCKITKVKYFAVRRDKEEFNRYFRILACPAIQPRLSVFLGHRNSKDHICEKCKSVTRCQTCGQQVRVPQDRRYKAMLITELLKDAFEDEFDVAYLVSGDNDYQVAVDVIVADFPKKEVVIALPPHSRAHSLTGSAGNNFFYIQEQKFIKSQLPDTVRLPFPDGTKVDRPPRWRK